MNSYQAIQALERTSSRFGLTAELAKWLQPFGVENIVLFASDDRPDSPSVLRGEFLMNRSPRGWLEEYARLGLRAIDPTIARAARTRKPLKWKVGGSAQASVAANRVFDLARQFGMFEGITFVCAGSGDATLFASISGRELTEDPFDIAQISLLSQCAGVRACELAQGANASIIVPAFSAKEKEVLKWVVEGKTDWEISRILNISIHTVDKYMRQLRGKANIGSRAQLAALAIRHGLA